MLRLIFWTEFNDLLSEKGKPFNPRKATVDHWYSVSIGISGVHIEITLVNKENYIGLGPTILDNKDLFDNLFNNKEKIEAELGFSCGWYRLENKKASRIIYKVNGLDFDDHSNYKELMSETIEKVTRAREVFSKFIKTF